MRNILLALAPVALVAGGVLFGLTPEPAVSASSPEQVVVKALKKLVPGKEVESIRPSVLEGMFEVVIDGVLVYVTDDGRYLLQGDLHDVRNGRNLSEERRSRIRLKEIGTLDSDSMIRFGPEDARHTITVFTDVDCGYCRKLHQEVGELNDGGVAVQYIAFPRAGIGSSAYRKMVSVWCAEDRQQALTDAKSSLPVDSRTCRHPVREHFDLGNRIGVSGTPAIVLESGKLLPGYIPAPRLIRLLDAGGG